MNRTIPTIPTSDYGRSDYNVGKAFKLYGVWQPVFFHGSRGWAGKDRRWLVTQRHFQYSLWIPLEPGRECERRKPLLRNVRLYADFSLLPTWAARAAAPATIHSRPGIRIIPRAARLISRTPTYTAYSGTNSGTALPQSPAFGATRSTGPGYKDVDMTLAKAFGLPNMPVLGENARLSSEWMPTTCSTI